MISSSDVPACPACGSREVHPVTKRAEDPVFAHTTSLQTFYACRQCGRDVTAAWEAIQPAPPVVPVIGSPGHENEDIDEIGQSDQLAQDPPADKETIHEAAMRLGICAELKT